MFYKYSRLSSLQNHYGCARYRRYANGAVAFLYLRRRRRRRRRSRRIWVHEILQGRLQHGEFHRLVQELRLDEGRFQRYSRLDREQFDSLLSKIGSLITRQHTNFRRPIPPAERVAICLRFLATGHTSLTRSPGSFGMPWWYRSTCQCPPQMIEGASRRAFVRGGPSLTALDQSTETCSYQGPKQLGVPILQPGPEVNFWKSTCHRGFLPAKMFLFFFHLRKRLDRICLLWGSRLPNFKSECL